MEFESNERRPVERAPIKESDGVRRAVQPRRALRVGADDDPAEREADRTAADVVRLLQSVDAASGGGAVPASSGPTRIRRAAAPAGGVGSAGGPAPEGLESRIAAARSSGRPLAGGDRAPMEQAFGSDFGRVRLHQGAAATALNAELGAQAFTLGQDIFVREPIDTRTPRDQHLLAHELAHTVQQGGSSGTAARTIQRAVGFEFEVGTWTLEALNAAPTAAQLDGTAEVPDTQVRDDFLTKDTVVHAGPNFNLKPDQADDGSFHIEYVIEPPFPETTSGRSKVKSTMKAIEKLNGRLLAAGANATIMREGSAEARLISGDVGLTMDGILITPRGSMQAEPQTTGGVRLDQLADLMAIMSPDAIIGETPAETTARQTGASYLAYKNAADAGLVAASPAQAKARFADFPERMVHSPDQPSKELVSFLALLRTYLIKAASPMAYAKSIAPIMARTDFGTIFAQLPEAAYYRSYVPQFVALVLHVAGMTGQGGQPFFSGTSTYIDPADWTAVQNALTREAWLRDLPAGVDRVTETHFPDPAVAGYLFGFGKLGTKTDVVGKPGKKTQVDAPVFELRRMAGSIDHRIWETMALELFDYFVALNRQKQPTFTATRTRAKHWSL